jgi:hypothetical protein
MLREPRRGVQVEHEVELLAAGDVRAREVDRTDCAACRNARTMLAA